MGQGLVSWLHAEAPDRVVYEHPPLALALCQIRYATKYGSGDSGVALFQEAVEAEYPNPEERFEAASIEIGGAVGRVGLQTSPPSPLWRFTDKTGDWTITLTKSFITLETRTYTDFGEFLRRLKWVLRIVVETVKPGKATRVGLRYINEIRVEHRQWDRVLRKDLIGILAIDAFRENCEQSTQFVALKADDAKINFNHGYYPEGTTVIPKQGTNAGSKPFYLIDIDMYREFRPSETFKVDSGNISKYVQKYHDTVAELFRWCTTDEYRATLGTRMAGD